MEQIKAIGGLVRDAVLWGAGALRVPESPGIVVIVLLGLLAIAVIYFVTTIRGRRAALEWLKAIVTETSNEAEFSTRVSELDHKIKTGRRPGPRDRVATAWDEYRETLIAQEQDGTTVLRNSVRPGTFFNLDDLHFGPGFWRIVPGLFVTGGLLLTFLGLISALNTMGLGMQAAGAVTSGVMTELLTVASAKFIMSLTGLLCSIVFIMVLRHGMGRVEKAIHSLNNEIENRLSFLSLEALTVQQLAAVREQREHFRKIGMELVAELGRPLREELPQAISNSISAAMSPLIAQVGQVSSDGLGQMVGDLSSRFSDDVGRALAQASDRLGEAGDRIGALVDRMDQSSGRMGSEMETSIARLSQAVDELRATMTAGADATTGAFSQGAEALLGAMNTTLQAIRENTGEGVRAMSAAAADIRAAAEGMRAELEDAAKQGADAARTRMRAAGDETSDAIGRAGAGVLETFGRTSADLARMTDDLTAKAGRELLQPLDAVADKLEQLKVALTDGATQVRRASDGIRAGAEATNEAAGTFRGSAQALVSAADPVRGTVERLEGSARQLAESTRHVADSARSNADSAARTLAAAQEALGGERRAIEATLEGLKHALERMRGHGDQLDDIDEKLGAAFETYTNQVHTAVHGLFGHVNEMRNKLDPALDTMREIVEQAEQFTPQSRRS